MRLIPSWGEPFEAEFVPYNFSGTVEWQDGCIRHYYNGGLHRTQGPAVYWPDGSEEHWVLGQLHRLNGAAVTYRNEHGEIMTEAYYEYGALLEQ